MSPSSHDARLEESLHKLRSIVARRNELLHEMFRMMQSRETLTSNLLDPGQENPHLPAFLQRFDISNNFDQGSITNLRQEDVWFLNKDEQRQSVSLPSDVEMEGHVVGSASSSLLAPIRHLATTSEEASARQGSSQEAVKSTSLSLHDTPSLEAKERPLETSDEDNDELDLIGQSTVSAGVKRSQDQNVLGHTGSTLTSRKSPSGSVMLEASPSTQTAFRHATEYERNDMVNAPEDSIPKDLASLVPDKEQYYPKDIPPLDPEVVMDAHVGKQISVAEVSSAVASGSPRTLDFINVGNEAAFPFAAKRGNESTPSSTNSLGAAHICVSLPPGVQEAILIPTPMAALKEEHFNIDIDLTANFVKSQSSLAKVDTRHHFDPQYIIPSLDLLPPEFTRKVKPAKLRRRDKNGEKELKRDGEKDSKRDRDENVPLGLNRWNAILTANPIWKKVSRASKCLSTRDWGVAMTELRLIRTIQRIDQLKEEGRWSYRQPKKQRGVGGLSKSHWDYVLDEMRWMRIDFREERRWKIALAYNLSTAVLEWHLAKTSEERQRLGICVKWQCPNDGVDQGTPTQTVNMDVEQPLSQSHHLGISYCSDEENGTLEESRIVVDALEPSAVIEDALMTPASDFHPKNEDIDDQVAIDLLRQGADEGSNSFGHPPAYPTGAAIDGLKTTSNDPLLGDTKSSSQSTNGDGETADPPVSDLKSGRTALAPIRGRIAYSETHQLFVATNDLFSDHSIYQALDTNDPLDLRAIFPELHPLGLLDVSATHVPADGKRKVEKRSDRDDPNRRIEDTTYTKLYPTGRFMYSKPTLIGPLQPAKRWKGGKWAPIEQTPITSDTEFNLRISEDNISELFDGRASTSNLAQQLQASSFKDKEGKRDSSGHSWSATDDALLKSLVDKYSMNWPLIAECFNSSRLSTLTDRRSAADCLQRWKEKWGVERKAPAMEPSQNSGEALSANPQMTTRGVKRLASTSIASPTTVSGTGNTEIKKRRRHLLLQDSMRKAGRKRVEAAQKLLSNQRKPPQVHETHNQFNKLPRLSPAELGRMKAERDLQTSQDIVLARKRQDDQIRQNLLLREQVQRGNTQSSQGQQPQSSQQLQTPLPAQQQQQQQQQQQLAQLQQLQQQVNQNPRPSIPTAGLPNRSARLSAAPNPRQAGQQLQVVQQQRPIQVQSGVSSNSLPNLLSQVLPPVNNVTHAAGTNFYGLPSNVTQEQVEQFCTPLLTAQQQQQSQSPLNNFGAQAT